MLLKSNATKVVAGFVGIAFALTMFLGATAPAHAQSMADLQAQIAALSAQLSALQGTPSTTTTGSYAFSKNLTIGSRGVDVTNLQKVLNMSADTTVASTGAGSPGNESAYFGGLTKAAVMKFQSKYGISPVAGYVGAITRAKLNSMGGVVTVPPVTTVPGCNAGNVYSSTTGQLCPTGTGTTPTPTGTGVTISAGTQPTASLAPTSAARVPFTRVVLTASNDGDVTVNSLTVERGGLAQDAVFAGVVLLDENGIQIGIAKTLNSNHQALVGDPFVVKAGTSRTITIAGNMASSLSAYAGQVATLKVVGVNTSATVNGSLPIEGAANTINATLSLGSATYATSSFDPNSAQTKEIGTSNYKFSGIRVTAGSAEKVWLKSIRWNQVGSVGAGDLGNLMTNIDGVDYPVAVSTDGKYFTSTFGNGILIDKGFSKDAYIHGDILGAGASGRTVEFDIYRSTDIYLVGDTFGYGITGTAGTTATASANSEFTTGTPFYSASLVTVSAGSVTTISKSSSVPAQNVAVNVPNQPLGGFDVDLKGESISVQSMVFTVATTTAGTGLLTNVSIVDQNGSVVAGPVDATDPTVTDGSQTLTFTDTVTFPIGKHTYTLKGRLPSTSASNETFVVSSTPSSGWTNITGQTSGNTISFSTMGAFSMNTMTVKGAALALSVSNTPTAQTIIAGATSALFSNIQLDATQSGEDVRFGTIPLVEAGSGTITNLTSCQLYDGTTALNTGSNVVNPSAAGSSTFTLDSSLTVAKGTVKTLAVKCNVSGSATGTYQWGLAASPSMTVTGVTSSNTVTQTATAAAGSLMTVGSGTLVVSADSSTPSYTLVASGSTGTTVGVMKFRAANDSINLNRIGLVLTNTASSSPSDLVQVGIYDGSTLVGTAVFTGANTVATSTLTSAVTLPKDADKTLTIKADFAQIGTSQPGAQGHLIAVDYNSADSTGTQGTGVGSGVTVNATGSTAFSGARLFRSIPTLSSDTLPSSGVADGRLLRFKVTANSNGDVGLYKFTVTLATTSANVTNINIFGYTDSSYSLPVSGVSTGGQLSAANFCSGGGCTSSSPTLDIGIQTAASASTTVQVPAGATRYFEVRGTVTGTATTYSVTTTLGGDAAFPVSVGNLFMGTTTNINSDTNNNFIWSPNATGTSAITADDFTNGYGLPGLPSNGIIGTRSN